MKFPSVVAGLRSLLEVGARNSRNDAKAIQTIHDGATFLGALCDGQADEADKVAAWLGQVDELTLAEADLSHSDVSDVLRREIRGRYGPGDVYVWLVDVFDDRAVYEETNNETGASNLFGVSYAIADDGTVTLGNPVEVRRQIRYVAVKPEVTPQPFTESDPGTVELELAEDAGELVDVAELREAAVGADGSALIKLIGPGWGSTGYYSADVLERDGASTFPNGTQMFWDHPTKSDEVERPERSLRDLAATLTEDASYRADGPKGPGLYANAKIFSGYRSTLEEIAPSIGTSIRALGRMRNGEAEGRTGRIVERMVAGKSVDFVTKAGAGGAVVELFESARGGARGTTQKGEEEVMTIDEAAFKALQESSAQQAKDNARLRERVILSESATFVDAELRGVQLPDMVKARLRESLVGSPILKDGEIDEAAFRTKITEAAKAEAAYVAALTRSGTVSGMGSGPAGMGGEDAPTPAAMQEAEAGLASALGKLGLSESGAKAAAAGR